MEEGAKGQTPTSTASPAVENIPKTRFDEVVGQRNRSDEQLKAALATVQNLTQMIQQSRQAPRPVQAQEHPQVKKLREEGRLEEANLFASLLENNRRLTATQAAMIEDMDRNGFLNKYSARGAQDRLNEVEQLVEDQRRRGNWQFSREQAFHSLIARDLLTKEERASANPPAAVVPVTAKPLEDDAPSSDPQQVTTIRQGGASEVWDEKTRDQEYQNLKDLEF